MRGVSALMALLGVLLALGGCASDQDDRADAPVAEPDVANLGPGNECIMRRSITGWQAVSRDMIMVEGIGKQRHLIRFSGACITNPRFEIAVGFVSRDFQICPYGRDALLIDGQRCTIWDIWELPPEGENTQPPAS